MNHSIKNFLLSAVLITFAGLTSASGGGAGGGAGSGGAGASGGTSGMGVSGTGGSGSMGGTAGVGGSVSNDGVNGNMGTQNGASATTDNSKNIQQESDSLNSQLKNDISTNNHLKNPANNKQSITPCDAATGNCESNSSLPNPADKPATNPSGSTSNSVK